MKRDSHIPRRNRRPARDDIAIADGLIESMEEKDRVRRIVRLEEIARREQGIHAKTERARAIHSSGSPGSHRRPRSLMAAPSPYQHSAQKGERGQAGQGNGADGLTSTARRGILEAKQENMPALRHRHRDKPIRPRGLYRRLRQNLLGMLIQI